MGSALSGQVCFIPDTQRLPSRHIPSRPSQRHSRPMTRQHLPLQWSSTQQRRRKGNGSLVYAFNDQPKRATSVPVRAGSDSTTHTGLDNGPSRRGHHSATISADIKPKRPRQTYLQPQLARVEVGFEQNHGRWQFYRHFTYRPLGHESPVSPQYTSLRTATRRPAFHSRPRSADSKPRRQTDAREQHPVLAPSHHHQSPPHGRKPSRHHQYDHYYHEDADNEGTRPMIVHPAPLQHHPQPTRNQAASDRPSPQKHHYFEEVVDTRTGTANHAHSIVSRSSSGADWPIYQLFQAGTPDARHDNKQQNKRH